MIGDYLEGVAHYVGKLRSIDLALQSMVDSSHALLTRSESSYIKACELHSRSLIALRVDLENPDDTPASWAMVLLANSLVYFAEVS